MQRFIKKNLFLVGVVGISAVGILVLLVLSGIQYFIMSAAINETDELRKTNDKLMGVQYMPDGRKRPPRPDFIPPVNENVDLLQKDIDGYSAREADLRKYFGQPLYPALKSFCDQLEKSRKEQAAAKKKGKKTEAFFTPEKMCSLFRTFWEEKKSDNSSNRKNICRNFITWGIEKKHWTRDQWEEAMDIFRVEAQKTTGEKITDNNFEDIFLDSIGVSRYMDEDELALFKSNMQKYVVELFKNNKDASMDVKWINFHEQLAVAELRTNENFQDNFDRNPSKDNDDPRNDTPSGGMGGDSNPGNPDDKDKDGPTPADEIRHWEIICDISHRICQAKIRNLERLAFADLTGRKSDDENKKCRFYTYTLTVNGTEQSVRNFMNLLYDAYKDHRIYVIRNISISKQEDQVQDVIDAEKLKAMQQEKAGGQMNSNETMMQPDGGMGGGIGRSSANTSSDAMDEFEEEHFLEKGDLNECVAGRSQLVTVTFTLDYVVYADIIDVEKK